MVNNSKAFMKTSHTHSLSFYFWSSKSQQGAGREHTYSKIKKNKQKHGFILIFYPTLFYLEIEKLFKCMHILNGAIFEKVTQVCSYSQQKKYNFMNARIWEINFPWNDGANNWWSMEWWCRPMTYWNQASI